MQKRAGDGRAMGAYQEPVGGLQASMPCPWALAGELWGCLAHPWMGLARSSLERNINSSIFTSYRARDSNCNHLISNLMLLGCYMIRVQA